MNKVDVSKDEDSEVPIPAAWRGTIAAIVESIYNNEFDFEGLGNVYPLSRSEIDRIQGNILAYGEKLVALPDDAWRTSICRWMGKHWDALVDLYTEEEGSSDLVLFLTINECDNSFNFTVDSVHVA